MPANTDNRNELLTATVILVNPSGGSVGLSILTRRLNVIPDQPETKDNTTTAQAQTEAQEDSTGKVASQTGKEDKESAKVESAQEKTDKGKGSPAKVDPDKVDPEKVDMEKGETNKAGDQGDKSNPPSN